MRKKQLGVLNNPGKVLSRRFFSFNETEQQVVIIVKVFVLHQNQSLCKMTASINKVYLNDLPEPRLFP
jgi:hypothetical protein